MPKLGSADPLIAWAQREEWRDAFGDVLDEHFGPACEDHDVDFESLPELLGEQAYYALWGCAFEDFLTRPVEDDDERTIVDDYLKRRGWKESASNKRYMEALRDSIMSLYEVSEIVPGQSFLAKDLILGGEPIRVVEHTATKSLKQWDRVGARIVNVSGDNRLSGGLLLFQQNTAAELLDELNTEMKGFRKEFKKQVKSAGMAAFGVDAADFAHLSYLIGAAPMFSYFWLDHALPALLGVRPQVVNSDGDDLSFHTVRFPVKHASSQPSVREKLDAAPELRAETDSFWNWIEAPPATAAKGTAGRKVHGIAGDTWSTSLDDGSTILGSLELKDGELVLEVNSSRRCALGTDMLKAILGSLVGKPVTTMRSLDEIRDASGSEMPPEEAIPEEIERDVVANFLDSHYRRTLDEAVPMLGGQTPRKAAGSAAGKRKLVEWLKFLENARAHSAPGQSYDFGWMWEELGIADLRT